MRIFVSIVSFLLLMGYSGTIKAGWNDNALRDLHVNVEYFGYAYRDASGEPVYSMGNVINYRITVYNTGKRPFKDFPFKGTLWWAGAVTCTRYWSDNAVVSYGSLQQLPGNAESGPHLLTINPGSYSFFEAFYQVPDTVCPNSGRITIDAGRGGNFEPLVVPERFKIIR